MRRVSNIVLMILCLALTVGFGGPRPATPPADAQPTDAQPTRRVLVQADRLETAVEAVLEAGGEITHELGIINAVAARLTEAQIEAANAHAGVRRIHDDRAVKVDGNGNGGGGAPVTAYPAVVGADRLYQEGITGYGVTVAVLDTGFDKRVGPKHRMLAHYDAIADEELSNNTISDGFGHGSHVQSIILNQQIAPSGGVDPQRTGARSGLRFRQSLRCRRRRQLRRRHSRARLDRAEPLDARHPGAQPLVRRGTCSPTTGTTRSTRPSWPRGGTASWWWRPPATRVPTP